MLYAYLSQAMSTLIGLFFTMLIPKILGVEGYGYWQLIVFYATYLGMFYFGINDGIYLRNGGKSLDQIDKYTISRITRRFFDLHVLIGMCVALCTLLFVSDKNRAFVLIATACYLPLFNIKGMLGQVMQAANDTKVSSIANLIDRLVVFAAVLAGLVFQIQDFRYYVVFYVVGGLFAALYCCYRARCVLFCKEEHPINMSSEILESIKAGLPLMVSSLSALMITGVSRQIIDMRWDVSAFSKISLALTMMNLILVFLNQSSLVLFPAIRKIDYASQEQLYSSINRIINIVVPVALVLYVPVSKVLELWLPAYQESVRFLGVLLPICIWDGKMNLINNTYYKVLRLERSLLLINIGTLIANTIFSIVGAYVFGNVNMIAYGLLISIVGRSLVSEIYLQKQLGKKFDWSISIPVAASIIYIALNVVFPGWGSFAIYAAFYSIVLALTWKTLRLSLCNLKLIVNKQA